MVAPKAPAEVAKGEYQRRRRALLQMAQDDAILILPAAPERIRSHDTHHPYRQDSDFAYLTGFPEPEAVLVLVPGRAHGETLLFCRERHPERARRNRSSWRVAASACPASNRCGRSGSVTTGRPRPMTSQSPAARASAMPARVRNPPVIMSGMVATARMAWAYSAK